MFKIAKLEDLANEKIEINKIDYTIFDLINKEKTIEKTLAFTIRNQTFSFYFELDCQIEKLLELPMYDQIDFNSYINIGEIFFNAYHANGEIPLYYAYIRRYIRNKFILTMNFFTDDYAGTIEIDFNLDDYLEN